MEAPTSLDAPVLPARGPEDLLAYVGHALGRLPEDSLVLLTLHDGRLRAVVRVDLPPEEVDVDDLGSGELVDALARAAGVPTVVYGFFAALTVGPALRVFFNEIGLFLIGGPLDGLGQYLALVQNQMALVAGAVMGIMLIPFVSSLSDDIINAVPQSLRDGSLAMGSTHSETIRQVVLPAALPGIVGAILLAASRAIGETMIVVLGAGAMARISPNPFEAMTTITVKIVGQLTGDNDFASPETLVAFALGLTLFVMTLGLNVLALYIVRKYREQYE